jgi:phosphoglycolate phosphatase-like HAD superfamily hydrolase
MGSPIVVSKIVKNVRLIFWDFDGVIKESVDIKTQAFLSLFLPYGKDIALKVKMHHEANGGMSRFTKLPLYLQWSDIEPTEQLISEFSEKFSRIVTTSVVNAPWVNGAEEFIRNNKYHQTFILVSATPQAELEFILKELNLDNVFCSVFGSPIPKVDAIRSVLNNLGVEPSEAIMIGDASADKEAADENNVPFLLRRHNSNSIMFTTYQGLSINDLTEL